MNSTKKNVFMKFFWIIGIIYTGNNLIENYRHYKEYPALTVTTFDANGKTITWLREILAR